MLRRRRGATQTDKLAGLAGFTRPYSLVCHVTPTPKGETYKYYVSKVSKPSTLRGEEHRLIPSYLFVIHLFVSISSVVLLTAHSY